MKNKRVVVTGGAGFIGSHLAEELSKRNDVTVVDNLLTGKYENIRELAESRKIKFMRESILKKSIFSAIKDADYVFHEAALPRVGRSVRNPAESNRMNVGGTLNVLLACKEHGVKKLVFASSSSVYGDTPQLPKKEGMHPNPLSPYAVTKMCGEFYCRVFHSIYELPVIILRYFNVYGPRQDARSEYSTVIPKFIYRVLRGKPPVIYGDGKQTRDFTFIDDVVDATIKSAESEVDYEVMNIGSGKRISINELASRIIELCGKEVKPVYTEPRAGDVRHSLADISKARKILGWKPRYSLEEGLERTISYFR